MAPTTTARPSASRARSRALRGLGVGTYQVKDATGTLTVVSDKGSPPPTGTKVGVKGKFKALFTLLSKSLAVLREESRTLR